MTDASHDDALRTALTGQLGEAYTLEGELSGGMSRVFVAYDRTLDRRVVVKVISPELGLGTQVERFRREIQVTARLQHPHIVPVLSTGEVSGRPYFVMPFVPGQSLRARLRAGPISAPEAVPILRDIARGLAHAHTAGVVHRDLKPENILLSSGSAVLTDFGIAKALAASRDADESQLTQQGISLGTPAYMAPEQVGAEDADHRADIYAFGIVAYELLSGATPFEGRPLRAMLAAHLTEPPAPLAARAPGAPPALVELVMRCLAKRPEDRPQDANAVLETLESLRSGGVDTIATGRLASPPRAKGRRIAVAASAAVVALAAFGIWRAQRGETPPADASLLAVAPFRIVSADPSLQYLREGMVDLLAAKLMGDGGLHAADPRALLAAWQRAARDGEPAPDEARRIAGELGAGRLLLGDVVGTPGRIVLGAQVLDVAGGQVLARESVEGPPDSLAALVDRLAGSLLTTLAGETDRRAPSLARTPLPALRAYLDGQYWMRRAETVKAAEDFARALEIDSTFALAGLSWWLAASWNGQEQDAARGVELAWRQRDQLGPRERALLDVMAGPSYPAPASTLEQYNARLRYLQIAPDRPDAHVLVGDHVLHYGTAVGVDDPLTTSLRSFRRVLEVDSTYGIAKAHTLVLATALGDTQVERRTVELARAQAESLSLQQYRWQRAHRDGDTAAIAMLVRDSLKGIRRMMAVDLMLFDGTGAAALVGPIRESPSEATAEAERQFLAREASTLMLVLGRPAESAKLLEDSKGMDGGDPHAIPVLHVRAALAAGGDTAAARRAASELGRVEQQAGTDSLTRLRIRQAIRVLEPWRLAHGDTSQTRRSLERLRAIEASLAPDAWQSRLDARIEIAMIEALFARRVRPSELPAAARRLDSLLQQVDYRTAHAGRATFAGLVAAQALEAVGDYDRAWAAARRRQTWFGRNTPYLAAQLREEGRLAALAGRTDAAIRAYRHYLALRRAAEPSVEPEVRAVRQELAKLTSRCRGAATGAARCARPRRSPGR